MSDSMNTGTFYKKKGNPASCINGARRYVSAEAGFRCEKAFGLLCHRIGISAATTYSTQRFSHGASVILALSIARKQVQAIGVAYSGGIECTPFRKKQTAPGI